MVKILLTTNGLKNINFSDYQNNFTFIVNGKPFRCSRIIADFISPRVAQMHHSDVSTSEIIINTKNKTGNFEQILNLAFGGELEVNEINQEFLEEISTQLENEEIFLLSIPQIDWSKKGTPSSDNQQKDLNNSNEQSNAKSQNNDNSNAKDSIEPKEEEEYTSDYDELFSRIKKKQEFSSGKRPISIDEEVEYFAAFFYEIFDLNQIKNKLKEINYSILYQILTNDKLVLKNEGQLANLIMALAKDKKDDSFYSLFEFVQFENLTTIEMNQFLSHFDANCINKQIWERLKIRLHSDIITPRNESLKRYKSTSFIYDSKDVKNEGILNHFLNALKKSKNDTLIKVSSSSGNAENILQNQEFSTSNIPNSWILFDFVSHRVFLNSYSIKCYSTVPYNMKQWTVEGSNNLYEWIELDSRNTYDLNQARAIRNFECKNNEQMMFRYLRIRHTGMNGASTAQMFLGGVEFYGDLFSC